MDGVSKSFPLSPVSYFRKYVFFKSMEVKTILPAISVATTPIYSFLGIMSGIVAHYSVNWPLYRTLWKLERRAMMRRNTCRTCSQVMTAPSRGDPVRRWVDRREGWSRSRASCCTIYRRRIVYRAVNTRKPAFQAGLRGVAVAHLLRAGFTNGGGRLAGAARSRIRQGRYRSVQVCPVWVPACPVPRHR